MLSMTCPAPRAAMGGKLSVFVMMNPQATHNTLREQSASQYRQTKGEPRNPYSRINGLEDAQINSPAESIVDDSRKYRGMCKTSDCSISFKFRPGKKNTHMGPD